MSAAVARSAVEASRAARVFALASPIAAASAGLAVMLVVVTAFGYSPALVARTFGSAVAGGFDRVAATLLLACPLLIIGLALTLAFRGGVWNIGAEGQYLLGALGAAAAARGWPGAAAAALPIALVSGLLLGGAWAGVAAALKRYRRVPDVLGTILLNFVAVQLFAVAVRGPLVDPASSDRDTTAALPGAFELPLLDRASGLHVGVIGAALLAPAIGLFLSHTTWGLRTRIVGANPTAARFARIPADAYAFGTFVVSGSLAGLAGAIELTGNTHYLTAAFSSGYGYSAIAVALLARLHPLGVVPAALFFAALETGARGLQKMPVEQLQDFPTVLVYVAQGVVILVTVLLNRTRLGGPGA